MQPSPVEPPIKPLWPSWPEKPWPEANLLLEGPSILWMQERHLLFGPTVAVNHAISRRVPIDFWATSDHPDKLWEWSKPHRHEDLRYFTTGDKYLLKLLDLVGTERVYAREATVIGKDHDRNANILIPTIIPTLAWLLACGVKRVRLFGCDMQGTHSPLHMSLDFREGDSGGRWVVERVLLSHAIRQYRAAGARIERWNRRPRRR